jgi:hypothetical protein
MSYQSITVRDGSRCGVDGLSGRDLPACGAQTAPEDQLGLMVCRTLVIDFVG